MLLQYLITVYLVSTLIVLLGLKRFWTVFKFWPLWYVAFAFWHNLLGLIFEVIFKILKV
jgi:hypothetical protein